MSTHKTTIRHQSYQHLQYNQITDDPYYTQLDQSKESLLEREKIQQENTKLKDCLVKEKARFDKLKQRSSLDTMQSSMLFLSIFFQPYCIITAIGVINIQQRNLNCSKNNSFVSGDCTFAHYSGDIWTYFNMWYWVILLFAKIFPGVPSHAVSSLEKWAARQQLTIAVSSCILVFAIMCQCTPKKVQQRICTLPSSIITLFNIMSLQKWVVLLFVFVISGLYCFIQGVKVPYNKWGKSNKSSKEKGNGNQSEEEEFELDLLDKKSNPIGSTAVTDLDRSSERQEIIPQYQQQKRRVNQAKFIIQSPGHDSPSRDILSPEYYHSDNDEEDEKTS